MDTIRWGLLGAGRIVNRWICGLRNLADARLVAVASRTASTAETTAASLGIEAAPSYRALLERSDIDAVYVAVPHQAHLQLVLDALDAGKAVLVEKPAGISAAQWSQMTERAAARGVLLMEAVWTRFFPLLEDARALCDSAGVGELRAINSAFAYRSALSDKLPRSLDVWQAGGGLLDVGVYNLHLVDFFYGEPPQKLVGLASINDETESLGVDEQAVYIASYGSGRLASMASAVRTAMIDTAYLYGTLGRIEIPHFWKPTQLDWIRDGKRQTVERPVPQTPGVDQDEGYQYEIRHFQDCLRSGLIESPQMTWELSARVLSQCDELRRQWGLVYPFECDS